MSEEYLQRFPIHGRVFETPTGRWRAAVTNNPDWESKSDRIIYILEFERADVKSEIRHLRLLTSKVGLHTDNTYPSRLLKFVERWLSESEATSEEHADYD